MQRLVTAPSLHWDSRGGLGHGGDADARGRSGGSELCRAWRRRSRRSAASWSRPGAPQDPNAPGWNVFFDALLDDLREYAQAPNPTARLTPLNRLYQMSPVARPRSPGRRPTRSARSCGSGCGRGSAWPGPSAGSTRPCAACRRRSDSSVLANRQRWVDFVENDLGQALAQYDGATTVAQRQAALNRVHQALRSLQTGNQQSGPGSPRGTSRPRSTTSSTSPTWTSRPTSTSSRRSSTRTS